MKAQKAANAAKGFTKTIGGTKFEVKLHYKERGETVEDKIRRLIGGELSDRSEERKKF